MGFIVKTASTDDEFEQLYAMNYQTFVEEIPQHQHNDSKKLIDKFDRLNTYFIVKKENEVVGMMAINTTRPFSLEYKLNNLEQYLPPQHKLAEVRLLSVKPSQRNGKIFLLLLQAIREYGNTNHIDLAVISGTILQLSLYHRIGFVDFANPVGTELAKYQPMYISMAQLEKYLSNI
jgi:N-acyl-L-homoserine lactone synthetase